MTLLHVLQYRRGHYVGRALYLEGREGDLVVAHYWHGLA